MYHSGTYPSCDFGAFDTTDAGSFFTINDPSNAAIVSGGTDLLMLDGSDQSYNDQTVDGLNEYTGGNNGPVSDWNFLATADKGTNWHTGLTVSNNDSVVDMSSWSMTIGPVQSLNLGGPTGVGTLVCTGGY